MVDLNYGLFNSSYRHIKYTRISDELLNRKGMDINVVKEEKFAFQLMLRCNEEFFCSLDSDELSWKGLGNRIRLEMVCDELPSEDFKIYFEGYVKDDNGMLTADPILRHRGQIVEASIPQMFWIDGKIPADFNKENVNLKVNMYFQKGYDDEQKIHSANININVKNVILKSLKESSFFLDLWQHPCNWAHMYEVPMWSEEHFRIIEANLEELASMGQKVIMLIVSDMPWAGQSCYKFPKNASNLFEHNIVKVIKTEEGNIRCKFDAVDRYIETAMKLGINEEIDLYGLLGVWGGRDFGNPIEDYNDPIRIRYFDTASKTYKYIKNKNELKQYLSQLFNHLIEKGWWDITRIASDEPGDPKIFKTCVEFLNSTVSNTETKYKAAVCHENFMDKYKDDVCDLSPYIGLTLGKNEEIRTLKKKLNDNGRKLTWYLMCVPNKPNNFIGSAPIESRLVGWFTYYFGLDGFLRWDYAIWPKDPLNEPSYKFPYWKAGDMFFVYPGKDGKPLSSLRWENMRFGIQDYQLLSLLQQKYGNKEEIHENLLSGLLGDIEKMKMKSFLEMDMEYSLDYEEYNKTRMIIMNKIEE